jgi:glutamate synthase domain-containing protein 1
MCGIVGLFLKDRRLEATLGRHLVPMLTSLAARGPDSAGVAVYGAAVEASMKITLARSTPGGFEGLAALVDAAGAEAPAVHGDHAVLTVDEAAVERIVARVNADLYGVDVTAIGRRMEIYKDVGHPAEVADKLDLAEMSGTHAIGHTRMATESAVTVGGAHPFSTGPDQCLVHNGSLSNHHSLRRGLQREGVRFATDNDSEVAAAYLTQQMAHGMSLRDALAAALHDLDGFYTFVVGTEHGFAVLRDPVACKPAVMAETDAYVAFGSEYRALSRLPGIESARVWEPAPATVYVWEHAA